MQPEECKSQPISNAEKTVIAGWMLAASGMIARVTLGEATNSSLQKSAEIGAPLAVGTGVALMVGSVVTEAFVTRQQSSAE